MKVAILSESSTDDEIVRILIEALIGQAIEPVPRRAPRGGWNRVVNLVSPTLKDLHYQRTADALVVVVDCDNSPIHRLDDEENEAARRGCRVCQLRAKVRAIQAELRPMTNHAAIQTAIAAPAPAIEAWLMFGLDPSCTDAGWIVKKQSGVVAQHEIRRSKREIYGSDRAISVEKAVEYAKRVTGNLDDLVRSCPQTFGVLAADVPGWTASPPSSAGG